MSKKVFIKTFGCQMNAYDSMRMADMLAADGYERAGSPADADLVILNTCHIRAHASEKVYSELGRLRLVKEERDRLGRRLIVAVAGCVAEAEGQGILVRAPVVDLVLGPQTYHRLPEMLERLGRGDKRIVETGFSEQSKFDRLPPPGRRGASAFLAIQEGCDKVCSFCVVPRTRGREYSRPAASVLREAAELAQSGACEIVLLGQNVNAYHGEGPKGEIWGLARLIKELSAEAGIRRIRYTTSHPRDMDDELIAAHRDIPALMPFLHLPVQSGSDRILSAMNRRHSVDDYLRIVEKLRAARPDIALSSDFIVGFPGETEADFQASLRLVEEVGFAQAYSFKYSPRPHTPAAARPGQVPEEEKEERLARLQSLIAQKALDFNGSCQGRTVEVLLERTGRRPGQLVGRSPYMQSVYVSAPESMINSLRWLRVIKAHVNSLAARLATEREGTPL